MLRSVKMLIGYKTVAKDGEIGRVDDFYFDDSGWVVRYLVVATGKILNRKLVLVSPGALTRADWVKEVFPVKMTKSQIENSPEIDEDLPVSGQKEKEILKYFNWPIYWSVGGVGVAGPEVATTQMKKEAEKETERRGEERPSGDPHLRSTGEVEGYNIFATDGQFGHVDDFIVDDETWALRYLVINSGNWLPGGRRILISPRWIKKIDWAASLVRVDMTIEEIENSPEFRPDQPINREYEVRLYDYYGRPRE